MDNRSRVQVVRQISKAAIRDFRKMNERTIFFLSDQTGVTAETLGHSLITQFDTHNFRQVTLPFIDSEDKAREAVQRVAESAAADKCRPIIFSTLVQPEFRKIVKEAQGLHMDIFDVFLEPLGWSWANSPPMCQVALTA